MAFLLAGLTILGTCRCARAAGPASPSGETVNQTGNQTAETITIPGPLRPFLRMAGISQESKPADLLPLLARNAFLYGHQMGKKTEYLVLEDRYVHQALELQPLAVSDGQSASQAAAMRSLSFRFSATSSKKVAATIAQR